MNSELTLACNMHKLVGKRAICTFKVLTFYCIYFSDTRSQKHLIDAWNNHNNFYEKLFSCIEGILKQCRNKIISQFLLF